MPRLGAYAVGLVVFGLVATNVAAQIYRWVDDKGTVHFTDDRPRQASGGVKEVVEAGARRTPLVRGGPEWRVDTPTPYLYEKAHPPDDRYYDEYDEDDAPRQGDTIIQVYEPPPAWFDGDGQPHHDPHQHDNDGRRHDDRDRHRDREMRPPLAPAPPPAAQPPAAAPPRARASSRALPLPR